MAAMSDSDSGAPIRNRVPRRRNPRASASDDAAARVEPGADEAAAMPLIAEGKEADRGDSESKGKETEPLLESKASGGAKDSAPGLPPKKPEKPPKKPPRFAAGNDSSSNNNNAGVGTGAGGATSSREELDANDARRSLQAPPRRSWFSFLGKSICCKMGYRMEPFFRDARLDAALSSSADSRIEQFVVAAVIHNVFASAAFVTGLVRPAVRVHCVYIDTGLYVKGPGMVPAPPMATGVCVCARSL